MTRPSRIAARVVAAVAWLGASLLVVDFPHARPVAAAASRLGLVSQTPYGAPADGAVTFVLSVPGNIDLAALPDATVVITAYRPVATRLDLDKVRAGTLPRIVDGVDFPAAALPRPAADQIGVVVTLETSTRSTGALQLANPGLYPVLVELQDNGTVLAELLTFVHRLPAADEPQEVALPVAVAMTTTSTVVIDDDNEVVVDSAIMKEFGLLADLLEASTVPISVRVPPALLFAIAQHGAAGAALADRLATGLARNEVLSSPRLPLDASQAAAAGQQSLYTQWLRDGEDDLTTFISNLSVGTVAFMDGPLTGAGGTMLRDLGARLIVTTPKIFDALPDTTGIYTDFSQLVNIEVSPGVNVDATVTDRRFATLLERRTTTPALTAVYAVTDLLAYRQEMVDADLDDEGNGVGDPSEHGVTLGTTDLSLPQIDTYRAIASLLAETPGLQPTTLERLGIRTEHLVLPAPIGEVTVGLPSEVDGSIDDRIAVVSSLSDAAQSTGSMLPVDDERAAEWQQVIDRLPTSALSDDRVDALATDLIQQFGAIRNSVEVPAGFSFTLTGRTTTLPIKLYNSSDTPLTVRVHMSSSKLLFPDGDLVQELQPLSFTEVPIKIEARTNGSFPVTLTVLTPTGDELAPPVTLSASVNALSGFGNLVTGAFLLVVLTWWVRHVRQNRRSRATASAAVRHPVRNGKANGNATGDDDTRDPMGDAALSPDAATSTLPPL